MCQHIADFSNAECSALSDEWVDVNLETTIRFKPGTKNKRKNVKLLKIKLIIEV